MTRKQKRISWVSINILLSLTLVVILITKAMSAEPSGVYNPATCTMEVKRVVEITPTGYITKPAGPVFSGKQVMDENGVAEFLLQAGSGDNLTTFVVEITYENLNVATGEVMVAKNER